jgi:RNA polymerase sigma-70 factor, ECF subfamily
MTRQVATIITDEQLAKKAQAKDREALRILLERHQKMVFSITNSILKNSDQALDATQNALLRVVRHLGSYSARRPFRPWLRTIAVRAALDQAKRSSQPNQSSTALDSLATKQPDPQQVAVMSETARQVQDALARLSPAQRAAFVCKEIEQMSTKETARAMGCRKATVRWHLFEARKKLAALLSSSLGGNQ